MQFFIGGVSDSGQTVEAEELLDVLRDIAGKAVSERQPQCGVAEVLSNWAQFADDWLPRYTKAVALAAAHAAGRAEG